MFPLRKKANSPTRKETEVGTKNSSLTTTKTRPSFFRSSVTTNSATKSPGSYKSVKESLSHLTDTVATSLLPDIKITSPELGTRGPIGKSTQNRTPVRQGEATVSVEPKKGIAEQFNEIAKTHVAQPASVLTRKVAPSSVSFGRGASANVSKNICGAGATYRRVDKACQLGVAKEACTTGISPARSVEMRQRNMVMAKIKFYELGGSISDDSVKGDLTRERKKTFQEEWKKKSQLPLTLTSDSQLAEANKSDDGQIIKIKTFTDHKSKNDAEKDNKVWALPKEDLNSEPGSEAKNLVSVVHDSESQGREKDISENSGAKEKKLIDQSEFMRVEKSEKMSENDNRTIQLLSPAWEKMKQSTDLASDLHSEGPKTEVPTDLEKPRSEDTLRPVITDCLKLSPSVSETTDAKDECWQLHDNRVQKQFLIGQNDDQISVITTTKYVDVAQNESSFTSCRGEVVKAMVTPPTPEEKQNEDHTIFMKEERSYSDSVVGHVTSEQDENPKDLLRLNTYDAESRRGSDCTGLKQRRKVLISPRRVVSLKRELQKKR